MPREIPKVETVPASFAEAFAKLNETIAVVNAFLKMEGRGGIKVHIADGNVVVEYNPTVNGADGITGAGGGLPEGFTFEEFTICDSGSPASRWLATWTSDPS